MIELQPLHLGDAGDGDARPEVEPPVEREPHIDRVPEHPREPLRLLRPAADDGDARARVALAEQPQLFAEPRGYVPPALSDAERYGRAA